ncbi:CYFA0S01e18932g1_1 [Cyberlindnera fabianii]|uniref:CYFA0S01e18932g1_1 n=1 Tax=Cyberlindnera fabianii TaxID=36022 RepID=A0A061AT61_CYBFA|nr:CYFA0S01e18932g1_1 [Cyberlindnera fabianii]
MRTIAKSLVPRTRKQPNYTSMSLIRSVLPMSRALRAPVASFLVRPRVLSSTIIASHSYVTRPFSHHVSRFQQAKKSSETPQEQQQKKKKTNVEIEQRTQLQQGIDNVRTKSQKVSQQMRENIKYAIPVKENIYTIPNILTFSRLLMSPLIGYLIVKGDIWWPFWLFTMSSVTDFVDGYIARKYNMKSILGSIIDPMADKFLMVICTACLAQSGGMPLYLAAIILGRDIMLGISAIYYRYISLPPPKTLLRYWDFSIPSAQVYPTTISKYNTGFQMLYIAAAVVKPVLLTVIDSSFISTVDTAFDLFGYLVATTTILSGLGYLFSKDAVKILTPTKK